MTYNSIVISSGHGKYVRGAHGVLDEVDEARLVVKAVADRLKARGVDVTVFHDDLSKTQNENLHRIVDFHNDQDRALDVSVHFNAFEQTDKKMGTEVLWITQSALAGQVSAAIAKAGGFIDRGGKKRTDLFFLNNTEMPSILIETCFVDSTADAAAYELKFDQICEAIATTLGGPSYEIALPPSEIVVPPEPAAPSVVRLDIEVSGNVVVLVNGVPVQ